MPSKKTKKFSSKARSKSTASVRSSIKISIGDRTRKATRTRRTTTPKQPQVVVVNTGGGGGGGGYQRGASQELSALEKNLENQVQNQTGQQLGGRRTGYSRLLAPPTTTTEQTQAPPAQKPQPTRPSTTPQQPPPAPTKQRTTLDLWNLSPVAQSPLFQPRTPDSPWFRSESAQTDLTPTRRRENPPLSPGETLDQATQDVIAYVQDNLLYAPRNRQASQLGRTVYSRPYLETLTDPATIRQIYNQTRENVASNRPQRRATTEGGADFPSPAPAPRNTRRQSGFFSGLEEERP